MSENSPESVDPASKLSDMFPGIDEGRVKELLKTEDHKAQTALRELSKVLKSLPDGDEKTRANELLSVAWPAHGALSDRLTSQGYNDSEKSAAAMISDKKIEF